MDDILSTALTEAGLDEFFVDDSLNKQHNEQAYNNGPPLLYDKNMIEPYYPSVSYEGMETIVEKEVTVTSEQTNMRQETFTENNNWEANRIKAVHIQNTKTIIQKTTFPQQRLIATNGKTIIRTPSGKLMRVVPLQRPQTSNGIYLNRNAIYQAQSRNVIRHTVLRNTAPTVISTNRLIQYRPAMTPNARPQLLKHSGVKFRPAYPSQAPRRIQDMRSSSNSSLTSLGSPKYDTASFNSFEYGASMNETRSSPMLNNNLHHRKLEDSLMKTAQQIEASRRLKESYEAKEGMKAAMKAGNDLELPNYEDEVENATLNPETFVEYCPSKLRSGLTHPDPVVETVSLNSVQPPEIRYTLIIPEEVIDNGHISALQLEAAIYACQIHEKRLPSGERTGYLIGDGAGVGKGRTIACIIYQNYCLGRKRAIWLSVSSDLKFDAERDLRDIGASEINVYSLNKFTYAPLNSTANGVVKNGVKKGVIFATYSSLIGESRGVAINTSDPNEKSNQFQSRLKQLIAWFGKDYDGVIVFDECHRAKNLFPSAGSKPTKTGKVVLELQSALPNARIVYASATGATEPRNMAYMTRLGLWGPGQTFPSFVDFINVVENRGVGAMEMVAIDMKLRGLYLARQLSFQGASFSVEEVPLSTEFIKLYDDSVKFWIECKRQFQYALKLLNVQQKKLSQNVWAQFWAAHQRFFKYLCIGAKVDATVRIAQEAIRQKKCVVIGLQSTGESQTIEAMDNMDGDLMDFVSTTKAVLYNLIDKHFPTGDSNSGSGDALKDLDRVFSIGEGGSSSSRKRRHEDDYYGFSLKKLKQMGYDPSSASNSAKNSDNEEDDKNTESENSSNEDDETDDEDNEESSDESNADEEKDELMNTLLAEIEEEESLEEDIDVPNEDIENADISDGPSQEDMDGVEINPFCMDFGRGHDPWARQQTIVVERQKEQQVEIKIKEKKNKKKKKTKDQSLTDFMKKERAEMAEKREETTQNADEFIKSTRFIENSTPFVSRDDITEHLTLIKAELLTAVEKLGPSLPPNTLDQLIDRLGGPENVAEMTGRRGRVVVSKNGDVEYQLRNSNSEVSVEMMNMEEKDKFMRGDKLVAIISEAASSGISLQADKRAPNKRKRVHITLELPWSADKAVQQFGRTHRSNQAHAPEYLFLISELSGEKRFASTVAKRLASLGALTHGDRRATDSRDLSQFNIDTKYGRMALDAMLHTIIGVGTPVSVQPPSDYKGGDFFQDMRKYLEGVGMLIKLPNGSYIIEKENTQITKFLNRILGLPVHAQNSLFQYFNDIISALIAEAKQDGTYDQGIMDLGVGGDRVQEHESKEFMGVANGIPFKVNLHKIGVERGVSWEEALSIYEKHKGEKDGFYIHTNPRSKRTMIALIHGVGKNLQPGAEATMYCIIRPNTGRSPKLGNFADLSHRFRPSTLEQAEKAWKEQFTGMDNMCMHKFLFGICRADSAHNFCEVGRRKRNYFVLSGSVLTIWPFVEEALNKGRPMARTSGSRMQVVRIRTESGQKIVGILVLADYVQRLVEILQSKCHGINVDNFLKQK